MHTVELLEQTLSVAQQLGYHIRHEWLGGTGGGACEFGGRKWLFVDLALDTVEQLGQAVEAIGDDPAVATLDLPQAVRRLLEARRAA